jgi:hypothetical protein
MLKRYTCIDVWYFEKICGGTLNYVMRARNKSFSRQ